MKKTPGQVEFPATFAQAKIDSELPGGIDVRDERVLSDWLCGIPEKEIARRVSLKEVDVKKIIDGHEEMAIKWHDNLISTRMIGVHNYVTRKVLEKIERMEKIMTETASPTDEFAMSKAIIDVYEKYAEMVASGTVLEEVKRLTEEAKAERDVQSATAG